MHETRTAQGSAATSGFVLSEPSSCAAGASLPAVPPDGALRVIADYDGVENGNDGKPEAGYLAVKCGDIVMPTHAGFYKGHDGNKYSEYVYARKLSSFDNDPAPQGWLPDPILKR